MKKTLWMLMIGVGLVACGEKQADPEEKEDTQIEKLTYTSWDLLTQFGSEGEAFIESLKGKEITITDCLVEVGSNSYISVNFRGYNGTEAMAYCRPDEGYKVMVNGQLLPEYKGEYFYLNLVRGTGEQKAEILPYEIEYENPKDLAGERTTHYRSVMTLETLGDSIQIVNDNSLNIYGAKVSSHINYK